MVAYGLGATVGAAIACRRPDNLIGWAVCVCALVLSVSGFSEEYSVYALLTAPGFLPAGEKVAWLGSWSWEAGAGAGLSFVLLLFPDGRLPSRRWRPVAWILGVNVAANAVLEAVAPGPLQHEFAFVVNPWGVDAAASVLGPLREAGWTLLVGNMVIVTVGLVLRRRRAIGIERQQIKVLVYAGVVMGLALLLQDLAYVEGVGTPRMVQALAAAALLAIPTALGVALLRYRLYDIDLAINRTIVVGGLVAFITGLYLVIVVGVGGVVGQAGQQHLWLSVTATAVVAVLFEPVRRRLQRGANRLVFGQRAEPLEAVSGLGQRLEAVEAAEALLPAVAETVADALRLPYVAIRLLNGEELVEVAAGGQPTGAQVVLPLTYQSEQVGQLVVSPRAGEELGQADHRLLAELARQAGAAANAVRLTANLRRSQQRLMLTREEERHRLRRDLHDGLGPLLAGVRLGLEGARRSLPAGYAAAAALDCLGDQVQAATNEVRRLVDDLRPTLLEDVGLVQALKQQAAHFSTTVGDTGRLQVSVEAPNLLGPLPAGVELAAYRIATEALTNTARHAHARCCTIRLSRNDTLRLRVEDDGVGLGTSRLGVGIPSMRERAAALGGTCTIDPRPSGGTAVTAELPLPETVSMRM